MDSASQHIVHGPTTRPLTPPCNISSKPSSTLQQSAPHNTSAFTSVAAAEQPPLAEAAASTTTTAASAPPASASTSSWRRRARTFAQLRPFQRQQSLRGHPSKSSATDKSPLSSPPSGPTILSVDPSACVTSVAPHHSRSPPRVDFSAVRTQRGPLVEDGDASSNSSSTLKNPPARIDPTMHTPLPQQQQQRATRLRRIPRKSDYGSHNVLPRNTTISPPMPPASTTTFTSAATPPSGGGYVAASSPPTYSATTAYEHPKGIPTNAKPRQYHEAVALHDSGYIAAPTSTSPPQPLPYKQQHYHRHYGDVSRSAVPSAPLHAYRHQPLAPSVSSPPSFHPSPARPYHQPPASSSLPSTSPATTTVTSDHHPYNAYENPSTGPQDHVHSYSTNMFQLETHRNPIPYSPIPQDIPASHAAQPKDGAHYPAKTYEYLKYPPSFDQQWNSPPSKPMPVRRGLSRHASMRRPQVSTEDSASSAYAAARLSDEIHSRSSQMGIDDEPYYDGDYNDAVDHASRSFQTRPHWLSSGPLKVMSPVPADLRSTSRSSPPPSQRPTSISLPSSPAHTTSLGEHRLYDDPEYQFHTAAAAAANSSGKGGIAEQRWEGDPRPPINSTPGLQETRAHRLPPQIDGSYYHHQQQQPHPPHPSSQSIRPHESRSQQQQQQYYHHHHHDYTASHEHPGLRHAKSSDDWGPGVHAPTNSGLHTQTSKPVPQLIHDAFMDSEYIDQGPTIAKPQTQASSSISSRHQPRQHHLRSLSQMRDEGLAPAPRSLGPENVRDVPIKKQHQQVIRPEPHYGSSTASLSSDSITQDSGEADPGVSASDTSAAANNFSGSHRKPGRLNIVSASPPSDNSKYPPKLHDHQQQQWHHNHNHNQCQTRQPTPKASCDSFEDESRTDAISPGSPRRAPHNSIQQALSPRLAATIEVRNHEGIVAVPVDSMLLAAASDDGYFNQHNPANPLSPTLSDSDSATEAPQTLRRAPSTEPNHASEEEARLRQQVEDMAETIAKLQREMEQHKTKVDMLESEVRRAQEQYVELELRHNEAQETESDLRDKLDERNGTIKKLKDEVARHQKREEQTENEVAVLREQFQKMSEQYTKERDVWRMEVEKYRKEAGKAYKRGEGDAWKKWKVVEELVSITRDELKESLVEMVNGVMSLEKGMRSVRDVVMFSRSFGNIWEDLEVGGESNPDQAMGSEEEGDSGEQDGDESAATNGRFVGKPPSVTTLNEDSADSDAKSAGGEDEETSMGSRVATSLSTSTTSHQPSNRSWIDND